jgi:hypothetical protein
MLDWCSCGWVLWDTNWNYGHINNIECTRHLTPYSKTLTKARRVNCCWLTHLQANKSASYTLQSKLTLVYVLEWETSSWRIKIIKTNKATISEYKNKKGQLSWQLYLSFLLYFKWNELCNEVHDSTVGCA